MKVLIIANARRSGGLSGSDAIYENFQKNWPCETEVHQMQNVEYKPFAVCYLDRILRACARALWDSQKYDMVYSASDFLPDVLPAMIYRMKGIPWVAGFYLSAFRENAIHFFSQAGVKMLINRFADTVIVANVTMLPLFPHKKKSWINGGIDMALTAPSLQKKFYDAVFCGRIHKSKGIDELLDIWAMVRMREPNAKLAIIGDGDMGKDYITRRILKNNGVEILGYMGEERYRIYKSSRIVLYPTPEKYDHFSMAPVEAMACGCPMVCFDTPVMRKMNPDGAILSNSSMKFAGNIVFLLRNPPVIFSMGLKAKVWASKFDYRKESLRVWEDINKEVLSEDFDNRINRDGWDGFVQKAVIQA